MAIIILRNIIRIDGFRFLGFGLFMSVQMFFWIITFAKIKNL